MSFTFTFCLKKRLAFTWRSQNINVCIRTTFFPSTVWKTVLCIYTRDHDVDVTVEIIIIVCHQSYIIILRVCYDIVITRIVLSPPVSTLITIRVRCNGTCKGAHILLLI